MGWELVPCAGAVERMRAIKDADEIARIRAAAELADEALLRPSCSAVWQGAPSARSRSTWSSRCAGSAQTVPAFPRSSPPAPTARSRTPSPAREPIARDVLVTIDWGALHEGYCSDCTRTYATGEHVSARAREVYELVRSAQALALDAVTAGPTGRELDAVARAAIERAGHGEHFGHGLGHGVGMDIHEAPRLSRTAGEDPLLAGNVVTVEPGVYLPGDCGVRIEDLLVVREDGHEVLTGLPKELTVIA